MILRPAIAVLLALFAQGAGAVVLWSFDAESGVCDVGVSSSVWDYTQSGDTPDSRFFYRCSTPVPGGKGGSKYLQVNIVNMQHDAWNIHQNTNIPLTTGGSVTYYFGAFVRFDRIGGVDVWHDNAGEPNSYDKLFEFYSDIRMIITSGFPDWANCSGVACNGKFTLGAYLAFETCSGCIYEQIEPNVSPYSRSNFLLLDYGRWHAVVLGFSPSTGSTANGKIQLWINGIKTTERLNIKTQDAASPSIYRYMYSGTIAQPAYDSPAHYRMIDGMMLSNSLADVTAAGLMSDPEAGGTAPTAVFTCNPLTSIQSPAGTTNCTDASTGTPTSWAWTSTRCGTSVVQNPTLTCLTGGLSDVCLTASNTFGSHQLCKTNYLSIRYGKPSNFGAQ